MKTISSYFQQKIATLFRGDTFFLYLAVLIGFALLFCQLGLSSFLYRDAGGVYAPMARSLACGEYAEAFHPGIPCLNVILSRLGTLLGMSPEKALISVSVAFYLATIPFVYLLLRKFLPDPLASIGSLLFACTPKVIRFSYNAIIDSGKIFFVTAALFFLIHLIAKKYQSKWAAFGLGAALGGMSLARSEGIGNAGVFLGCLVVCWLIDRYRTGKMPPFTPLIIVVLTWMAGILFRMLINWKFCGSFMFDERIAGVLSILGQHAHAAETLPVPDIPRPGCIEGGGGAVIPSSFPIFFQQFVRGSYEIYLVFALIGGGVLFAKTQKGWDKIWPDRQAPEWIKWNHLYWLFLIVPLANAMIFYASCILEYRYFLLNVPLLMIFTMIGMFFAWQWARKICPRFILVIAIAVVLFFQVQNGSCNIFASDAREQSRIGKAIAACLGAEKNVARIWFKTASAEWYYSGTKRAVPIEFHVEDFRGFDDFDYVLWEVRQKEFATLAKREDLQEIPLPDTDSLKLFKRVK